MYPVNRKQRWGELFKGITAPFRSMTEQTHSLLPQLVVAGNSNASNKELTDSIIYAKRIQEGMMLRDKHLYRMFPESFILNLPKSIVSGDFYWFTRIENKVMLAVADCTGHGIPGAFMSVLGISLLNQIIIEEGNTDVSSVLRRLDHKVEKAFSYSKELVDGERFPYDGMDIVLCCVDIQQQHIDFAGAMRPLYHLHSGGLKKMTGSRYPIGGLRIEQDRKYEATRFGYQRGDRLFLSSDGYADQFGGKDNKKFMAKNFHQLLQKTSAYSIRTQHMELSRHLYEWKNNVEQTDDVLVLGVEL